MNEYLLIYQGDDPDWAENTSPEDMEKEMALWGAWFKDLEASGNLRNPGAPLGPGGSVLRVNNGTFAADQSMHKVKDLVGGYSILAARDLDEATELAKGSPFLQGNPNGNILVRPILEMN